MAAADYYQEPSSMRTDEDRSEIQAQHIDQMTLLFQARLRGFLVRCRVFHHDKNENLASIDGENHRRSNSVIGRYTRKIIYKIIEDDEIGDNLWQPIIPVKTENAGLQAQYQNSTNSVADDNKKRRNKVKIFSSTDETAIAQFLATTSEEAMLESAAKWSGEAAPWWIESPPDSEEGGLCNICRRINFDILLHKEDALMYEMPIPLGTLPAIARKTECSFCRLVAHTGSHTLQSTLESLRYHGVNVYCELCDDFIGNKYATAIRHLCLKLTVSSPNEKEEVIRHGCIQQILNSGERPPEQSQNDSRVVQDQIDLELVRCWLETCKEQHNSTYLQSNLLLGSVVPDTPTDIYDPSTLIIQPCQSMPVNTKGPGITLVDVERECLVDMPSITSYVALSYVWGGPQSFQNVTSRKKGLYNPHSISVDDEAIPRTIQDAIWLAAKLGEKYIWVDSLCICQDDKENKMKQIANMANIYSQALFTIVAASGSDASAGLPGVRAFSRHSTQQTEWVQGILLANELLPLEDIVRQSYWNTRGWTYQEKELCKRYLIFCETHVFFQCNRTVYKEDSGLRNHAIGGGRALQIRGERQPIWNSYRRAVVEYTKRTLSYDSDVVNAFQGIASLLQPAFKGEFLFGLPETELDVALLWQPTSLIRRRVDPETRAPLFPSWSWAGWIGEVTYLWTRHQIDDISRVEWQCTDSESGNIRFCTSDELRAARDGDHGDWEYVPNSRGTPYYYQHNNPDIWCLHPVAPKDKRSKYTPIQPDSHRLIFRAYTAFFRIASTSCTSPSDDLGETDRTLCPFRIFDQDGFAAGRMYVPARLIGTLRGEHQELVCLSRRRYDQMDDGPAPKSPEDDFNNIPDRVTLYPYERSIGAIEAEFDHRRYNRCKSWPLYNVMMIDWDKGVASRVALGTMHVTAFVQAKPTRKVITLA